MQLLWLLVARCACVSQESEYDALINQLSSGASYLGQPGGSRGAAVVRVLGTPSTSGLPLAPSCSGFPYLFGGTSRFPSSLEAVLPAIPQGSSGPSSKSERSSSRKPPNTDFPSLQSRKLFSRAGGLLTLDDQHRATCLLQDSELKLLPHTMFRVAVWNEDDSTLECLAWTGCGGLPSIPAGFGITRDMEKVGRSVLMLASAEGVATLSSRERWHKTTGAKSLTDGFTPVREHTAQGYQCHYADIPKVARDALLDRAFGKHIATSSSEPSGVETAILQRARAQMERYLRIQEHSLDSLSALCARTFGALVRGGARRVGRSRAIGALCVRRHVQLHAVLPPINHSP